MWSKPPPAPLQRPGGGWEDSRVQSVRSEELLVPLQRPDPAGPRPPLPRPDSDQPDPHPGAGHQPWYDKDHDTVTGGVAAPDACVSVRPS